MEGNLWYNKARKLVNMKNFMNRERTILKSKLTEPSKFKDRGQSQDGGVGRCRVHISKQLGHLPDAAGGP